MPRLTLRVHDIDGRLHTFVIPHPRYGLTWAQSDRVAQVYEEAGLMRGVREPAEAEAAGGNGDAPPEEERRPRVAVSRVKAMMRGWLMAMIPELTPEIFDLLAAETVAELYDALQAAVTEARDDARRLAGEPEPEAGEGAGAGGPLSASESRAPASTSAPA